MLTWRPGERSPYDAMAFISIPEFAGCIPDSNIDITSYSDPDITSGDVLDHLTTGDGSNYVPRPLTPGEIAQLDDLNAPNYYGNVTDPIMPELCRNPSRPLSRVVSNSVTPATIAYKEEAGEYILINDPPVLKSTGEYVRGDFNKEKTFHQEPGEVTANVTSNSTKLPEKGALADKGYSQMHSAGQRSLFKGTVSDLTTIVVSTWNQTGDTIYFALLFTTTDFTGVYFQNYGAVIGSGNCEEAFISGDSPRPNDSPWHLGGTTSNKLAIFLAKPSGSTANGGVCTFSGQHSRAIGIPNNTLINMHLELYTSRPVMLNVVVFDTFTQIPADISADLQYWGTYPFSRYSTGNYANAYAISCVDKFRWTLIDNSGEGWLPVTINGRQQYHWGTHALPKFPEPCPDNPSESCADRYNYFYRKPNGFSEIFPINVKRANYTLPAYDTPVITGQMVAWPNYSSSTIQVPRSGDGRDPRTPDIKYANLANWGVVYTEYLFFRNDGSKKRVFSYNFLEPATDAVNTSGNRRAVAVYIDVLIALDGGGNNTLQNSRLLYTQAYDKPTTVFNVCCPPYSAANVTLRYVLCSGSAFGLLHNIQTRLTEDCSTSIGPMFYLESED